MLDTVKAIIGRQRVYFGNKFNIQWQGLSPEEMTRLWAAELKGFSMQEIKRGMDSLRNLKYPPTLPEFMQLCRPPIDPAKAYYEAVKGVQDRTHGKKGEWSHPAIFWASARMASDLLNRSYSAIKDQWKMELDKELEKTSWDDIPEVPILLKQEIKKTDKNVALEALSKLSSMTKKKGNSDWIKKNLERVANGEITNPTVIKMTREAYKFFHGKEATA